MTSAVVYSKKHKITIGAFIADRSIPFGIHRSGPAIELGLQKLNELTAGEVDVEVIRYISGLECTIERNGLFATVLAEMYFRGNISAIVGPSTYIQNLIIYINVLNIHDCFPIFNVVPPIYDIIRLESL
jgi:hypothetical protein